MKWIYLIIAIITEVIATSALKESQGFSKVFPSIIVVVGYSLTFYFMSLTLKEMSVGITYAIWSGMGILLISLIGYFRYNQVLDSAAILGMSFIAMGIIILRFFQNLFKFNYLNLYFLKPSIAAYFAKPNSEYVFAVFALLSSALCQNSLGSLPGNTAPSF